MKEFNPHNVMNSFLEHIPKAYKDAVDARDAIYVVESPSPDDLLHNRNEGDALARVLKLAGIDVYYFFAATEETFEEAFKLIAETIKDRSDHGNAMPWLHISAHGGRDGVELTDGGVIQWPILSRILTELHQAIGHTELPPPMPQNLPKASLCLSSCGAFQAYRATVQGAAPFQCLVGSDRDIGWCQALIAFSTFYYLTGTLRKSVDLAVMSMNFASGTVFEDEGPAFQAVNLYNEGPWTMPPG
jgi:hypothetical protein